MSQTFVYYLSMKHAAEAVALPPTETPMETFKREWPQFDSKTSLLLNTVYKNAQGVVCYAVIHDAQIPNTKGNHNETWERIFRGTLTEQAPVPSFLGPIIVVTNSAWDEDDFRRTVSEHYENEISHAKIIESKKNTDAIQ